jgi:hypothetical protein
VHRSDGDEGWLRIVATGLLFAVAYCVPATAAEAGCATTASCPASATSVAADDASAPIHFFGDTSHLQATSDQVSLASQPGPLPISVSGNIQSWTSGPPLSDLYTEAAQGFYRIDENWKILGQQLYQQQGSITLANFVGGFNYKPNDDISLNVTAGIGVHTLYTYQWSTYISPQYVLPWSLGGKKRVALEADTTFENYVRGNFSQVTPKLDLDLATWLPQLQIGYAFGNFENTTSISATQYYQPQTIRGVTLTAVLHPLDRVYIVASYLPANRNYIAGSYVRQNSFGGTIHWNLNAALRLSAYGEDTWYQGGSDRALGGGLGLAF